MAQRADPPWGEALTILRLIRRWTQNDLAEAVGLSFSAISRYESGTRSADAALQRRLDWPVQSRSYDGNPSAT